MITTVFFVFFIMVFSATFRNISAILWWSVLLVEEIGGGGQGGPGNKGGGKWELGCGKWELGCGKREKRGLEPGCYEAGTCRYRAGYILNNMKQKVLKWSKSAAVVNHLRSVRYNNVKLIITTINYTLSSYESLFYISSSVIE